MTAWMAVPPPVVMSPSKPGSSGVTTYTLYFLPSLKESNNQLCISYIPERFFPVDQYSSGHFSATQCLLIYLHHQETKTQNFFISFQQIYDIINNYEGMKWTPVRVCVSPVSSDDALGDGVSYLVENIPVVCTADEELILGATRNHQHTVINT